MRVAILGAGLMGRLLALYLDKHADGIDQLHLFERGSLDDSDSTGRIAAAMIAPVAESVTASAQIVKLGQQSLTLWPQILQSLNLGDIFQQQGSMIVWHRQDKGALDNFINRLSVTSASDYLAVSGDDFSQLEPELAAQFHQAYFLAGEGQVDNEALYQATSQQLLNSKVHLHCQQQVELGAEQITLVSEQANASPNMSLDFDYIIDCRGLGAKQQLVNNRKRLRGIRGEVIRVRAPEVNLTRPIRLMHPRYPLYIVPKPDHQYVIGATEIESEDDSPISIRSALELLSATYSVHKGFAEATILQMNSGLRPTFSDHEPAIDVQGNTLQVNGLYRHGYLLAPAMLAKCIKKLNAMGLKVPTLSNISG